MISVHSCVRGRIPVHLPEKWRFQCIHVWGVRFRYIYLRDDDFDAFMCEGYDSGVFTWGVTIWVHSCVSRRIPVHLLEGSWFQCIHVWGVGFRCIYPRSDDFCAFMWRGRIPVHVFEGWWFRCIHVWGVGFRCIYLRRDDFGAFMCQRWYSGALTWGMMISVHLCVRGRIPVHWRDEWRFRCIHVWGVRFRCIYLRDDHFGAFMCEG